MKKFNLYCTEAACFRRDSSFKNKPGEDPYKPELLMNSNISLQTHEIIKSLGLSNVHLLGKCNGGWIATLLLARSNIYEGLYLAVPGIPYSIKSLKTINRKRLDEINFVFGWTEQDCYEFHWCKIGTTEKTKSKDEKERYDSIMKEFGVKNYKSFMFIANDVNGSPKKSHNKDHHELFPEMITKIIETI
jgi:hypothetical protein